VEAGIAELAAGKLFKVNDIPFRFVKESKVKRADYDIEYATLDSRLGRCEVKCKLQSNDFTVNGIRNILKAAKDQLPKGDGTGIVLLRIPEEWWDPWAKPAGLTAVSSAVEEFFAKEKTTRISSVLVLQHRTDIREGHMAQFLLCKEHPNPHCSIKSGLPPLREAPPPRSVWTPLLAVVN